MCIQRRWIAGYLVTDTGADMSRPPCVSQLLLSKVVFTDSDSYVAARQVTGNCRTNCNLPLGLSFGSVSRLCLHCQVEGRMSREGGRPRLFASAREKTLYERACKRSVQFGAHERRKERRGRRSSHRSQQRRRLPRDFAVADNADDRADRPTGHVTWATRRRIHFFISLERRRPTAPLCALPIRPRMGCLRRRGRICPCLPPDCESF